MERFKNSIFKQREDINNRMAKMFRLLKELTTSRAPEKVLIREEAKYPVTKIVNSISLTIGEEEKNDKDDDRFNDSLSGVRVGKMKGNTYNLLPRGPLYEAILKKKDNNEGEHWRKL
nr:hypothetical protein [Tanacetum cinerariifolium]